MVFIFRLTHSYVRRIGILLFVFGSAAAAGAYGGTATPTGGFSVAESHLIGGEGSWDYAQYDPARQRLFVARVGGVLVIDTRTMKPVGSISAFAGTRTHGIALAPELGLGMTSDGEEKTSTVFNLATLALVRRIALGHAPDGIVYDRFSRKAIAFDGDTAVAFDPSAGKVVAEIALPGSPEAAASDGNGHVYVNISDKDEIATIDTAHWKLENHWQIGGGCKVPTPLAMNAEGTHLFVGCRSGILAVVNVSTHAVVAALPIGKGADTVAYDPKSRLVFVSCWEGTLAIVAAKGGDYRVLQTVSTVKGARTLALDPVGPRIFLPVADLGPLLPQVGDIPSRPAIVPDTFRILTVARRSF